MASHPQRDRLRQRIETMNLDRLDGRISASPYDEKSTEWHEQLKLVESQMAQLQTTTLRTCTEAVQIMRP